MPPLYRRFALFLGIAICGLFALNHLSTVNTSLAHALPEENTTHDYWDWDETRDEHPTSPLTSAADTVAHPAPPDLPPTAGTPQEPLHGGRESHAKPPQQQTADVHKFQWRDISIRHPVMTLIPLPTSPTANIPRIQHDFSKTIEDPEAQIERKRRLAAVKEAFEHSWNGYSKNAWLHDEVKPISGTPHDPFGGWGATLVDTLDTLWIMDMKKEFETAVKALDAIDFGKCAVKDVNIFETTIRYLGGFLSAYDLSGRAYPVLLEKAEEVAEMMYRAFDTKERMPITRWDWRKYIDGQDQVTPNNEVVAELGSLTMEFTRLSQLNGDPKWFDAVQRITNLFEREQNHTKLPGLWPLTVNPLDGDMSTDTSFTLGGMADSVFEYLPKTYLLLQGRAAYGSMYLTAIRTVKSHLIFEPLLPAQDPLAPASAFTTKSPLILGTARINKRSLAADLDPRGEHLVCFAGGMIALAARALSPLRPASETDEDMDVAIRLAQGCMWSYTATPSSIGPEIFSLLPCRKGRDAVTSGLESDYDDIRGDCTWDVERWKRGIRRKPRQNKNGAWEKYVQDKHLEAGFTHVDEPKYILRPEAIESLFVLFRITGNEALREGAWEMFKAITKATRTEVAFAEVVDVMQEVPVQKDGMESFWTAETLKYFYLIFAEPEVVSLDEFVFNTEAHPLRWREVGDVPKTLVG